MYFIARPYAAARLCDPTRGSAAAATVCCIRWFVDTRPPGRPLPSLIPAPVGPVNWFLGPAFVTIAVQPSALAALSNRDGDRDRHRPVRLHRRGRPPDPLPPGRRHHSGSPR